MKKSNFIIIIILVLISCNNQKIDNNQLKQNNKPIYKDNALLYNTVIVKQEIDFHPVQNTKWKENLVKSNLLKKIYSGALEGIQVFSSLSESPMLVEDVKISMGKSIDSVMIQDLSTGEMSLNIIENPIKPQEITALFFKEHWYMDENLNNFEKTIESYSPVRKYISELSLIQGDSTKISKRLIFTVKNHESKDNFELIAKDVISEFSFEQENPDFIQGLNKQHFADLLINSVLSGQKKAYSFSDFTKEISIPEIKTILGIGTDTIMTENLETGEFTQKIVENTLDVDNVLGVVFIEDWYFNPNDLSIRKKVKAIAPIWEKLIISDSDDSMESKSLPFVVKMN